MSGAGTKAPILQHYYTRAQSGFDTVAMSPSLDRKLIQSVLQPLCFYKAPLELQGVDDEERYPESLTILHLPTRETVISRSVFVSSDFTGQRSAAFTHQYIVPASREEEFIRQPEKLFRIRDFVSRYDTALGKQLPDPEEVEYARDLPDLQELLNRLRITQEQFLQLLYAVMTSFSSKPGLKKKVYAALDADVTVSSREAKALAEWICRLLPYSLRRQFGVNTFNREPEAKTGIQLMFVEKGSIAHADRLGEKDALFDFPNRIFRNQELPGSEHIYLDFVWNNRTNEKVLEDYFRFCDTALGGMGAEAVESVGTYYQLCGLYRISQGDGSYYVNNRAGVINGLLTYLTRDTAEKKQELAGLLRTLLEGDLRGEWFMPTPEYVEGAVRGSELEPVLKPIIVAFLVTRLVRQSGQPASVFWIPEQLIGKSDMFAKLITTLFRNSPAAEAVAEAYMLDRIGKVQNVKSFQQEWTFWMNQAPDMAVERFFSLEMTDLAVRLVTQEPARMVKTGEELYKLLDSAAKSSMPEPWKRLSLDIKEALRRELLDRLEPRRFSLEEWGKLGYLFPDASSRETNKRPDPTVRLTEAVYRIVTRKGLDDRTVFQGWDDNEAGQVHDLLRDLFRERIGPEHFDKLVFAFGFPQETRTGTRLEYRYQEMLYYVSQGAGSGGAVTVARFIEWASRYPNFLDDSRQLDSRLQKVICDYYLSRPKVWKDKEVQEILRQVKNPALAALFRKIERRHNPVLRFMDDNRKELVNATKITGLLVLAAAVGVTGFILVDKYLLQDDAGPVSPTPTAAVTPAASPTPASLDASPSPGSSLNPSAGPGGTLHPAGGSSPSGSPGASPGPGTTLQSPAGAAGKPSQIPQPSHSPVNATTNR